MQLAMTLTATNQYPNNETNVFLMNVGTERTHEAFELCIAKGRRDSDDLIMTLVGDGTARLTWSDRLFPERTYTVETFWTEA